MKFVSLASDHANPLYALDSLIGDVAMQMRGRPDVVFLFFTADHADSAARLAQRINEQLEPTVLLGTCAESIIGFDREIERSPGLSLLAASLPGVKLHPFHCDAEESLALANDADLLRPALAPHADARATILLADPFSTPLLQLLTLANQSLSGIPIIGGVASGVETAGDCRLILNDQVHTQGMAGLTLAGPLSVQTVVSQGCRPIGKTFLITKARENIIETLGGRPTLTVIQEVLSELEDHDRALLEKGLFVGRVIDEYRESFGRGDFLVRNVMRVSQSTGAVAITDYVRAGQTVQFHVRDAATADEDLTDLLQPLRADPPAGGLLFTCNGRGQRMFAQPGHDIAASQRILPRTPVAGFFAAGEIGPIGGKNFLHGHTASFAMFRPTTP